MGAALAALTMSSADAFTTKNPVDIGFVKAPCSLVILSDTKSPFSILDYRFNKCPPIYDDQKIYPNGDDKLYLKGVHKDVFPLEKKDYGGRFGKKGEIMQKETDSESVVLPNDVGLLEYKDKVINLFFAGKDPVTEARLVPLFPGDRRMVNGVKRTFWDEFKEVVHAQILRRSMKDEFDKSGKGGLSPKSSLEEKLYPWPNIWYEQPSNSKWPRNQAPEENTLLLDDVAMSVEGEFSNAHQQSYLINITGSGVDLTTDMGNDFRCELDFLAMPIRMAAINAWSLEMVGPVNFNLKWHFGLCRPEEVAWLIHTGDFNETDGVPPEVISVIQSMKLQKATDFTAYENGSPMHPSFPAMHSAGSTCSLWVPALYDITPEQYLEALRTDYGVAFARTVAGVHYPQDNFAGLNIGQRVIRERLPKFLSENYGYEPALVADKVNKLSFDWNKVEFTEDGCTIEGKSHIQFLEEAKNVLKKPVVSA